MSKDPYEQTQKDLERLFDEYLFQIFTIGTMNVPRGLSHVAMKYLYNWEPKEGKNEQGPVS